MSRPSRGSAMKQAQLGDLLGHLDQARSPRVRLLKGRGKTRSRQRTGNTVLGAGRAGQRPGARARSASGGRRGAGRAGRPGLQGREKAAPSPAQAQLHRGADAGTPLLVGAPPPRPSARCHGNSAPANHAPAGQVPPPSLRTTFPVRLSKQGRARPPPADAHFQRPLTTEKSSVPFREI